MELDLQSLFGLHVHSSTHWLRDPTTTPHSPHFGSYKRVLLVGQDRQHLFVTPPARAHTVSKIEILKCRVPVSNTLRNIFVLPFTGQLFYGDHLLWGEGKVFGGERESVDMKDRPDLKEY